MMRSHDDDHNGDSGHTRHYRITLNKKMLVVPVQRAYRTLIHLFLKHSTRVKKIIYHSCLQQGFMTHYQAVLILSIRQPLLQVHLNWFKFISQCSLRKQQYRSVMVSCPLNIEYFSLLLHALIHLALQK